MRILYYMIRKRIRRRIISALIIGGLLCSARVSAHMAEASAAPDTESAEIFGTGGFFRIARVGTGDGGTSYYVCRRGLTPYIVGLPEEGDPVVYIMETSDEPADLGFVPKWCEAGMTEESAALIDDAVSVYDGAMFKGVTLLTQGGNTAQFLCIGTRPSDQYQDRMYAVDVDTDTREIRAIRYIALTEDAIGISLGQPFPDEEDAQSSDASGFVRLSDVVPDVMEDMRFYSTYNPAGERLDGIDTPCAVVTKEAAEALARASEALSAKGYRLLVWNAYLPFRAVEHLRIWAENSDESTKEFAYPDVDKTVVREIILDEFPDYTHGSTVDVGLFEIKTGTGVTGNMGYGRYGSASDTDSSDYYYREILKDAMEGAGFVQSDRFWWKFTLADEPYPDTVFTFCPGEV